MSGNKIWKNLYFHTEILKTLKKSLLILTFTGFFFQSCFFSLLIVNKFEYNIKQYGNNIYNKDSHIALFSSFTSETSEAALGTEM